MSLTAYSEKYLNVDALAQSKIAVLDICAKLKERAASVFSEMPRLTGLYFIPNLFNTETIAWLAANLNVQSEILNPYVYYYGKNKAAGYGEAPDVLICGRRKPSLYSDKDKLKIEKYAQKFYALKEKYRDLSYEQAFGQGEN